MLTKNTSLKTIEGRINGLLRIFFIAYQERKYDLYQKCSILMFDFLFSFTDVEDDQTLNENEKERFIPYVVVINFQKRLLEQYIADPTYKNNQDLLLVSLYRWLPEKDELKALKFTTINKTNDDYIYITGDEKGREVYLLLNKDKKRHGELHINLSKDFDELSSIVIDSYNKFERVYVFTN